MSKMRKFKGPTFKSYVNDASILHGQKKFPVNEFNLNFENKPLQHFEIDTTRHNKLKKYGSKVLSIKVSVLKNYHIV